ncbi:hypothetical protein [Microtetraspora malaysiensis]
MITGMLPSSFALTLAAAAMFAFRVNSAEAAAALACAAFAAVLV